MRVHVCAVRMTLHRADVLEAYLNGQDNIQKEIGRASCRERV